MMNGAGKKVDKKESCVVTLNSDKITIVDSGGVDDHVDDYIEWTVGATDVGDNTTEATCKVVVVNPGKGKK